MKWIRSPIWDSAWFLSAPLLAGLILLPYWLPHSVRIWIPLGMMAVSLAHTLSPIVLAWGHRGYRRVMLGKPAKYIGVPIAVMSGGALVAMATWVLMPQYRYHGDMLENVNPDNLWIPFVAWANLYAVWNLYHAGAQNFGFLCLYRRKGFRPFGRKLTVMTLVCAATIGAGHFASRLIGSQIIFLACLGLITVNHWLAAIGLSSHVWSQHRDRSPWIFIAIVLAAGVFLVALMRYSFGISAQFILLAMSLRAALGIWHFLQDRWIWKLSDPQVRATIGRDLGIA